MKNKAKILIGAVMILSQMFGSGLAFAMGTEVDTIAVPVGSYSPEVYIKRIVPDEQKITMYHHDQGGRDRLQWLAGLNVVWPKEQDFNGLALDLADEEPDWANTFYNGNAQLLLMSGWEADVEQQSLDGPKLSDNQSATLYFSVRLASYEPELDQKYWVGKADYSDCMQHYQPGLVCEGVVEEDLSIKYYPYLNGVLIEEKVGNEEIVEETKEELKEEIKTEVKAQEVGTKMPVLLAGVGSAVIDSGNTVSDDESDEAEVVGTQGQGVVVAGTMNDTEIPELGENKGGNPWLLVLGAFAAAAGALVLWWWIILPLLKRRKDEVEDTELAE